MNLARTSNLLGALSVALVDRMSAATSGSAGHGAAVPAALATLHNADGITIGELARVLGLSHAGTVRVVDRLVGDDLVARHRGVDGREVSLRLSTRGRRTARAVLAARAATLEDPISALDPDDVLALERIVGRLLAELTSTIDVADHICRLCDDRACPTDSCPVECAIADQR